MFEKEDEYFPIKQSPACQLKWTWSTLWLTEAKTNSCHRCLAVPLDKDNFDNFHNYPHKIKEREKCKIIAGYDYIPNILINDLSDP